MPMKDANYKYASAARYASQPIGAVELYKETQDVPPPNKVPRRYFVLVW